ncbi:MAG: YbaB/EbfC family nucleoid-associated protein, partial [OM182 bacterium]|nr:YbaB/EbfC family nucleoid-associated protein [OM182 bacterium]
LVRVEMTGKYQVNNVKSDESLLSEEISVIEDLLAAAVNSAVAKVAEASKGSLNDLAGGITLPEGFKMPF